MAWFRNWNTISGLRHEAYRAVTFNMLGPIFDTLLNGGVLVVDELGSSMHPLLTKAIVSLFNSNEHNPNNAQLIFATHDTNLLSYGNFRRDQIYFIEKDRYGASNLYSLVEYKEEGGKTIRKDRSFEKDYIHGRYGGIPFIGDFSKLMTGLWTFRKQRKITSPYRSRDLTSFQNLSSLKREVVFLRPLSGRQHLIPGKNIQQPFLHNPSIPASDHVTIETPCSQPSTHR